MMKVLGLSGLPVAQAGHACWQRPHSVQVKPSRRSFQPRSWSDFSPNVASSRSRSIAGSSPRGRSLRYQMLGNDVAMWRCLLNGRYTRNAATRTMCAHHSVAKPSSSPAGPTDARRGPARAADTNAPGWLPNRANSKTSAKSSVATTPPIIARMIRASRLYVRRLGREMSRRSNAQAIDTRTITATTFCIALIAAQIVPPSGAERIVSMIPPVTTLAVPIVSRTKPQKIPACISPARGSLNILRWTRAYSTRPARRAPIAPNGVGCSTAGRVAAKTRRCRAMARANTTAAPQNTRNTTG